MWRRKKITVPELFFRAITTDKKQPHDPVIIHSQDHLARVQTGLLVHESIAVRAQYGRKRV